MCRLPIITEFTDEDLITKMDGTSETRSELKNVTHDVNPYKSNLACGCLLPHQSLHPIFEAAGQFLCLHNGHAIPRRTIMKLLPNIVFLLTFLNTLGIAHPIPEPVRDVAARSTTGSPDPSGGTPNHPGPSSARASTSVAKPRPARELKVSWKVAPQGALHDGEGKQIIIKDALKKWFGEFEPDEKYKRKWSKISEAQSE